MPVQLTVLAVIAIATGISSGVRAQAPGAAFSDCDACPRMVVVPAGSFRMGDLAGVGIAHERPAHHVTVGTPFAIGATEITFAEWDACVADGGCSYTPPDDNWGRGARPVHGVSWKDTAEYLRWLQRKTGRRYRLPTEAEWEYAARAGTSTVYPWGDDLGAGNASCQDCGIRSVMAYDAGGTPANAFGLHDMVGSQREWVSDCWNVGYEGAPSDGSAWMDGDCSRHPARGGSWYDSGRFIRSASRTGPLATDRDDTLGFRVGRDLD